MLLPIVVSVVGDERAYSVEEIRRKHPRAYARWTPEEDVRLLARYENLIAKTNYWRVVNRLAREFGRRRGGIRTRLIKLGIDVPTLRPRIPDLIRQEVWVRDAGMCVDCGSRESLQFDHIIPISRGGATSTENVELRCASCNVLKADLI